MGKLDLQAAYRRVPVSARGNLLRQSPSIWPSLCLQAIHSSSQCLGLCCRGVSNFLYHLDAFFFCSTPSSPAWLEADVPLCEELSLPIAPAKLQGPSTIITILGIEINSVGQEPSYSPNSAYVYPETVEGPPVHH